MRCTYSSLLSSVTMVLRPLGIRSTTSCLPTGGRQVGRAGQGRQKSQINFKRKDEVGQARRFRRGTDARGLIPTSKYCCALPHTAPEMGVEGPDGGRDSTAARQERDRPVKGIARETSTPGGGNGTKDLDGRHAPNISVSALKVRSSPRSSSGRVVIWSRFL